MVTHRVAAIQSVAAKTRCTAETLRSWLSQRQCPEGHRPGLTHAKRERQKELARENRDLRRPNEILRKRVHVLPGQSATAGRNDGVVHRPTPLGAESDPICAVRPIAPSTYYARKRTPRERDRR
jgi:transposase-like protein